MTEFEFVKTHFPDIKSIQTEIDRITNISDVLVDKEYQLSQIENCHYISLDFGFWNCSNPEIKFFMDDTYQTNIYLRMYQKLMFENKEITIVSYKKYLETNRVRKILSTHDGYLSDIENPFL